MDYFNEKKVFPTKQITDAKLEPINIQKKELPKIATYLCYKLKSIYTDSNNIYNTLKYNLQIQAESILINYLAKTIAQNIRNRSIIVIENKFTFMM